MKIFVEDNSRSRRKYETIDFGFDTADDLRLILQMITFAETLPEEDDVIYALTESRNRLDKVIRRIKQKTV